MDEWLQPGLRFLNYALLLGLFGWASFRVIGLRSANWVPPQSGRKAAIVAAGLAPFVSTGLMLSSIAAMMGQPLTTLDGSMVEAMTLSTDLGWAFIARMGLLFAGFVSLIIGRRAGVPIAAIFFAVALMTLGWSGHAAATEGALGWVHRLGNGVHLLAAGLWIGAIGWFGHLTMIAHRKPGRVPVVRLLAAMHAFAPFGVALVATVSVTGLINAQLIFGLENGEAALSTRYGVLLAAKIAIVGAMLGFGAHNARVSSRSVKLSESAELDHDAALSSLRHSLAFEMSLGIVVLGLVAILGTLSPVMME
jgi:putative copper resistance protein D